MRSGSSTLLVVCILLLTACGAQISFKQGAGTDAYVTSERKCRAQASNEGFVSCMNKEGWTVRNVDVNSPLMTLEASDNNSGGAPASATKAAPNTARNTASNTSKSADPKLPQTPPDPLKRYAVSSWWKMGGSPEGLKSDTENCVTTLGPAHRPQPDSLEVTYAMIGCLKGKGWQGLQAY